MATLLVACSDNAPRPSTSAPIASVANTSSITAGAPRGWQPLTKPRPLAADQIVWDSAGRRLLLISQKPLGAPTLWVWDGSAWLRQPDLTGWPKDRPGRWIEAASPVFSDGGIQFFAVTSDDKLVQFRLDDLKMRTLAPIRGFVTFAIAEPAGSVIVHVASPNHDSGTTYRVAGGIARRLTTGSALLFGAWDPRTKRPLAESKGTFVALVGDRWRPVAGAPEVNVSALASDDESIVIIESAGDYRVRHLDDGRSEPNVIVGGQRYDWRLGVDRDRQQIVAVSERSSWVSTAGGPFRNVDSAWDVYLDFRPVLLQQASRLLLVTNRFMFASTETGWQSVSSKYEAMVVAASPTELFASEKLDLLRLRPGEKWTHVIEPRDDGVAPDGRFYQWDGPFGYDPQTRRVVVFAPIQGSDETWIEEQDHWRVLADRERPDGRQTLMSSMATTPKALYLIDGVDLWVFAGDRWRRVSHDPSWLGMRALRFDPAREVLYSVGHHEGEPFAVGVFDGTRWNVVERLPSELAPTDEVDRLDHRGDISATWGIDGTADRAMIIMPDGSLRTLALGAYALPMHRLPE